MNLVSTELKYLFFLSLFIASTYFNNTDNSKPTEETVLKVEPLHPFAKD